jgi:hypothetical protein
MRKICYFLLTCLVGAVFYGCNKDQVSAPSMPTFTVDKAAGLIGDSFTFTVNQGGNTAATTLFPYGTQIGGVAQAGISIDASRFVGGTAQVSFSYTKIGTFSAVVLANNHTANGNAISNVISAPQTITIGSGMDALTSFSLLLNPTVPADSVSFPVTFPKTGTSLTVLLPFGNGKTQTNVATGVKALYSSSPFSTVTLSSTNFSTPVTVTVTANNGTAKTYTVTATVTPAEKTKSFKANAKNISKSGKNKLLPAAVDSVAGTIVVYDTLGSVASTDFDSLAFEYAFKGSFAVLKYGTQVLKQDALFNLSSGTKTFVAHGQDSTTQSYAVYAVAAPKLTLSFNSLNPVVNAKTTNFSITADVLNGTNTAALGTTATVTPAAGTTVSITANGALLISGVPANVDYTKPVAFVLSVTDTNLGISYLINYTATVNVVK